jgi:lysophospholipase L1-like esterase
MRVPRIKLLSVRQPAGVTVRGITQAIAAILLAVTMLLAGVEPVAAGSASKSVRTWPPNANVFVVGDSLTFGEHKLGNQTRAYRSFNLTAAVDAAVGRSASGGVAVLRKTTTLPETVVFALGTNDACGNIAAFSQQLSQAKALARNSRFVVVTVHAPACRNAAGVNSRIRAFAARHRGVVVADWASAAAQNPSWVSSDGIHLTTPGYRARALFIAAVTWSR